MLVYTGTKRDFMASVENGTIAREVRTAIEQKMGRHTPPNEYRAFENSLPQMHIVLSDRMIPDNAGIAIEYNLPLTSKRVDFIISGYNDDKKPSVVIVELKQWDKLTAVEGKDALVETYINGGQHTLVHPSYQAWSYAALMADYNETVQKEQIVLSPCAYLHNYFRAATGTDPIDAIQYKPYYDKSPAFTKGDVIKLRSFIKKTVSRGDNKEVLYLIENGKMHPSKSLQDAIASMISGKQEFVMIDDQKRVYEEILYQAVQAKKDGNKRTIIVKGGPGTGKTVVAINLLAELTQKGQFAQYTSKNSAPRNVYKAKLSGKVRGSKIDAMFTGSGSYTDTELNYGDTILADEAHRLNEKSGMFKNLGENQIKEIIHSAKCSVFFIDESQRVTTYDIGSADEIKRWAEIEKSVVTEVELVSQFRCNGSDGYLAWLDNVLQIRETANYDVETLGYDFRVLDTPQEVFKLIKERNEENHRSRMVAGYCWEWPNTGKNNKDIHEIKIDGFEMSWNLGNYTFAIDDSSIDQAGCIHTTQGLEFDYVGVIIGDDMRFENGHIITDFYKRASTDQSIKGLKTLYKKNKLEALNIADEIIKNTYRTLMTRGMKGCYVYCTDAALSEYLRNELEPIPVEETSIIDYESEEPEIDYTYYMELPIVGAIAAGYGIIMEEDIEGYIFTPKSNLHPPEPEKYFWLRIDGDSMTDMGIDNGDYALIRKMSNPKGDIHKGDIVAAQIRGDSATLKTYRGNNADGMILHPENEMYDDIIVSFEELYYGEANIIGKMVCFVHQEDIEHTDFVCTDEIMNS